MSEQRMYPGMSPEEKTSFAPYSAFDIPADLRELHGRYDVESTARPETLYGAGWPRYRQRRQNVQ